MGHSVVLDIDVAEQETFSESLSVQLRPNRKDLRILNKEDTVFSAQA